MKVIGHFVDEMFFTDEKTLSILGKNPGENGSIELGYRYKIKTESDFIIRFSVFIQNQIPRKMYLSMNVILDLEETITDAFKKSKQHRDEAAKLAYPYLETFILGYFSLSGYGAISIPSIDILISNKNNQE